ncbi:cingulin-like protein 1 isoform X2 [Corythoichthys intestinalis]|uniref:cingulin-like protein 1 isoform X2 n=1 Tax=Corythoichthys intestinalis TaxID=161448 RepID=UPI0025A5479D|nr:cingulin-like protein 1 isoform X2 [Corythoichthys intestinalis]
MAGLGASPEMKMQKSYVDPQNHRSGYDSLFGVRVQVQGIKGQPFVVLNTSGEESHKDVSVITHQSGYKPGMVRRSVDETSSSLEFHYQKHPEILKPYDPRSNNLKYLEPSRTLPGKSAERAKARIPLPAEGPSDDQNTTPSECPLPTRSLNSVDSEPSMSVGKLINQFNSSQRRGRGGPRNRLDPEETRRSRSVDSGRASDSSSSSSSGTPSLRGGVGGMYPPGSARARLLGGEINNRQENKTLKAHQGIDVATKAVHRTKESSHSTCAVATDERDAQVTPDLLKGQQVSVNPKEDAAKQMLFTYLKEGTTDELSVTKRKVELLLERINRLKWKTAENVEEEDRTVEVKHLLEKREALESQVCDLKQQLDTEMKNEKTLAKACEKARTEKKKLQEEVTKSQAELSKLRNKLMELEAQLKSAREELTQMISDRERSKAQMKDLQQQLSEMHDELDQSKKAELINAEKEVLLKEMAQLRADFQEMLLVKEEHEELLQEQGKELSDLKAAIKDEVETHDKYIAALKQEYELELEHLLRDLEKTKETNDVLGREKVDALEEGAAAKEKVHDLSRQRDQFKGKVQELSSKVDQMSCTVQESKASERLQEQRVKQLEREKQQLEETLQDVRRNEEEMCQSNRLLLTRLEEVQSKLTKLNHEHRDMKEKLREERKQTEDLWKCKSELEDERRLQDRTVEQLQRKMNSIMEDCEASTDVLQSQVDEAKERSQRELAELRRQLQEKGAELEKSRLAAKKLQDELVPLEEDLRRCHGEQQQAQSIARQLEEKVEELEERNASTVEERERHVKLLEGRIGQLEEDVNDERNTADRLMERLDKTKEQVDEMRSELMQERAVRQDLECDNISLERQNKDLKSRLSHLEGSQRTNQDSLISKLNSRIQELEERLQGEERDNNNLQQTNRKLERKVKEMKMQADEEHANLQTQRDQLTQRLKTAKRQMDEAEEEIERLEHAKKKLQRELEEQLEANEHLHGQIDTMRKDMRRKRKSPPTIKVAEDRDRLDDTGSD